MADDKQKVLKRLVSLFCKEKLDSKHEDFAVNLVEKMGRKYNVPFKRGKLEIWAGGIIYAVAQKYNLFDKNKNPHISADEICDYFEVNKSSVSKKATTISDMFNLRQIEEPSDNPSHRKTFFDEVNSLIKEKKYQKALKQIDTINEDDSDYPIALFYKSTILSYIEDEKEKPDIDQSGDESNLLLKEDETENDFAEIDEFFTNGLVEFNKGNFEDALDLFDLSASFNPDESEVFYYKALTLGFLNDFEEAVSTIDKAIMIDYDDYRFWNDKANFLTNLGDWVKAEKCYNQAIKLNPNDSLIIANKGYMYIQFGKLEEALSVLDRAHKLDPSNIHAIVGKANIYIEFGDYNRAKELFDEIRMIGINNLEYLMAMGNFLALQEKYSESILYWDRCLEIDDELAIVWLNKALMFSAMGNNEEYERCLNKASELDPLLLFNIDGEDEDDFI